MMNRIHHTFGVHHEYWVTNVWGWLLLAMSIALLVLAATGVPLWFLRSEDRMAGGILTAVGVAWGLTSLILMRLA